MGVLVNSVLIRIDCIKYMYYISLFAEIILQQFDAFQTKINGSLTKLCAFKAFRGHPSEVSKFRKGTLDFNFECIKFLKIYSIKCQDRIYPKIHLWRFFAEYITCILLTF